MQTTMRKLVDTARKGFLVLSATGAITFGILPAPPASAVTSGELTLFNAPYYLTANPDVKQNWSPRPPVEHYIQFGYKTTENRKPASWFNATDYQNTDLDAFGSMNALELFRHYCQYGSNEGRIPSGTFKKFDAARYLRENPDVAAKYTSGGALKHYLTFGATEGRKAYNTDGVLLPSK